MMREPSNYDLVVPSRSSSDVDKQNGTDAPKEEDYKKRELVRSLASSVGEVQIFVISLTSSTLSPPPPHSVLMKLCDSPL